MIGHSQRVSALLNQRVLGHGLAEPLVRQRSVVLFILLS
jgi:hypothetical protein